MIKNKKPYLLITGVTSGVGLSLVNHYAGPYHILAIGRNKNKLNELYRNNQNITCFAIDLSNPIECSRLFSELTEKYGYIPNVINNAGVNKRMELPDITYDKLMEFLHVNTIAPMIAMQQFLPTMKKNNFGRIINITSGAPLNCFPGFAMYSATKGALNAITVTAAREYADHNIKINLMSPGPVRSNMAPDAPMDPSVCHPTVDYLLQSEKDGPTGKFFWLGYEIPLFPKLEGIQWLEGEADKRYKKVIS